MPAGDWLTPGIRIEAANLLVEDCDIDSDDDAICFKSDLRDFTVENVVVRNCRLSSNCNAVKFGTSWVGGKGRNILVEGLCARRRGERRPPHDIFRFGIDGGGLKVIKYPSLFCHKLG